jgi:hypothetical protein
MACNRDIFTLLLIYKRRVLYVSHYEYHPVHFAPASKNVNPYIRVSEAIRCRVLNAHTKIYTCQKKGVFVAYATITSYRHIAYTLKFTHVKMHCDRDIIDLEKLNGFTSFQPLPLKNKSYFLYTGCP